MQELQTLNNAQKQKFMVGHPDVWKFLNNSCKIPNKEPPYMSRVLGPLSFEKLPGRATKT